MFCLNGESIEMIEQIKHQTDTQSLVPKRKDTSKKKKKNRSIQTMCVCVCGMLQHCCVHTKNAISNSQQTIRLMLVIQITFGKQ